jgi:hypothetical protein
MGGPPSPRDFNVSAKVAWASLTCPPAPGARSAHWTGLETCARQAVLLLFTIH